MHEKLNTVSFYAVIVRPPDNVASAMNSTRCVVNLLKLTK